MERNSGTVREDTMMMIMVVVVDGDDGDEDNDWWTIGSSVFSFTCVCAINENIFGYSAEPVHEWNPPYIN